MFVIIHWSMISRFVTHWFMRKIPTLQHIAKGSLFQQFSLTLDPDNQLTILQTINAPSLE